MCRLALPAGVGVEGGGSEFFELAEQVAQSPVVVDPGLVVLALGGLSHRHTVFAAILRVHCQYGPCRRGGSAWQAQLPRPHRVRLWVMEPGRTMPVAAMAASSPAIWRARAWWLAATRTVSGWHGSVI